MLNFREVLLFLNLCHLMNKFKVRFIINVDSNKDNKFSTQKGMKTLIEEAINKAIIGLAAIVEAAKIYFLGR